MVRQAAMAAVAWDPSCRVDLFFEFGSYCSLPAVLFRWLFDIILVCLHGFVGGWWFGDALRSCFFPYAYQDILCQHLWNCNEVTLLNNGNLPIEPLGVDEQHGNESEKD